MSELIDRAETLQKLCAACYNQGSFACISCVIPHIIKDIPTSEAEPVRHGRWNYRHEDDWCYCTACGTDAEGSDGECLETDFCPNCGAKMDGGADNG